MAAKMLVDLKELQDETRQATNRAAEYKQQVQDLLNRHTIVDEAWSAARTSLTQIEDLVTRKDPPLTQEEQQMVANKARFETLKATKSKEHTELGADLTKARVAAERQRKETEAVTAAFRRKIEWCAEYLSAEQLESLNEEVAAKKPRMSEKMDTGKAPASTPVEKAPDGTVFPSFKNKNEQFRSPELVLSDLAALLTFPPALEVDTLLINFKK